MGELLLKEILPVNHFRMCLRLILIALLTGITFDLRAQVAFDLRAQEDSIIKINAGEIVVQVLPIEAQYYYQVFQPGTIWLKNGNPYPTQLNYNLLYGEMHFIDTRSDTLALAEAYLSKKMTIGEDLFYLVYKIGCVKVISDYPSVNLVRQEKLEIIKSEVPLVEGSGGNGVGGPLGFSMSYSTTNFARTYQKLYNNKAPGYLHLARQSSYYFIDQNERFYPAKKSMLLKLFRRHKAAIDQYIKDKQTDFTREEDLKNLLEFCAQWTKR